MAAPRFQPVEGPEQPRWYESPPVVPEAWLADRPADLVGPQPAGPMLGTPGPDQGYALRLAELVRPDVRPGAGLTVEDAVRGATAVAMRRAALLGRAPVMADLRMALGIWGFLDDDPPAELVQLRVSLFDGVGDAAHHYAELRRIADLVPEVTLRATPAETKANYPTHWRTLLGV